MKKIALIALKPEFFADIKAGKKSVEYRRSFCESFRGDVYIYVTAPFSRVMAKFSAKDVHKFTDKGAEKAALRWFDENLDDEEKDCVVFTAIQSGKIFAIPIEGFQCLDNPLSLDDFAKKFGVKKRLRMPWNPAELIEVNSD